MQERTSCTAEEAKVRAHIHTYIHKNGVCFASERSKATPSPLLFRLAFPGTDIIHGGKGAVQCSAVQCIDGRAPERLRFTNALRV